MTAQLSPDPVFKAFDNNGAPLVGGQLFTYAAGTLNPQATFKDATQVQQNTNPVILNSRGEANLWLNPAQLYKLQLQDSGGNTIWTVDNVSTASVVATLTAPVIIGAAPANTSDLVLTGNNGTAPTLLINSVGGTSTQDLVITGIGGAGSPIGMGILNTSTGTAGSAVVNVQNNLSTATFGISVANQSAASVTGGPAGQSAFLLTQNSIPLTIGTNGFARAVISATGGWTFNGPGSGPTITVNAGPPNTSAAILAGNGGTAPTLQINSVGNTNTQDLVITGSAAGPIGAGFFNLSTGTVGSSILNLENTASTLSIGMSVTNQSGASFTGGPTGQQAFLGTQNNVPLVFGANSNYAGQIAGAGNWTIATPASGVPFTVNAAPANQTAVVVTGNNGNVPDLKVTSAGSDNSPSLLVGTTHAGLISSAIQNLDTGTSSSATLDVQVSNNTLICSQLSSGFSGTPATLAGGPSGQQAVITTSGTNQPLSLGANSNCGLVINRAQTLTSALDLSGRGIAWCRFKAADTSRASNTTIAADPDLTFAITAAGTYAFELMVVVANPGGVAGGTPGFSFQMNYSGTFATSSSYVGSFVGNSSGAIGNALNVTANQSLGASTTAALIQSVQGTLQATTSGTLALQWAQQTSSANATVVRQGSYLTVTQLS